MDRTQPPTAAERTPQVVEKKPKTKLPPDQRPLTHTVQKGDTLYAISLEYGFDYKEVAEWNGITSPDLIKIGQQLRLTPPSRPEHLQQPLPQPQPLQQQQPLPQRPQPLQQPQPLSQPQQPTPQPRLQPAQVVATPLKSLAVIENVAKKETSGILYVTEPKAVKKLYIEPPVEKQQAPVATPAQTMAAPAETTPAPTMAPPPETTPAPVMVAPPEAKSAPVMAAPPAAKPAPAMAAPPEAKPATITPSAAKSAPVMAAPPVVKPAPAVVALPEARPAPVVVASKPAPMMAAPPEAKPNPAMTVIPEAKPVPVAAAPPAKPSGEKAGANAEDDDKLDWGWPTRGKVVAEFSETSSAKGVDISGKAGQPVFAAASGKVVYSGSSLRGYGKLIIIKHNKTYLSAYAHNSQILVKEGQSIAKGQKIAEMGDSDTDRIKLHFEIRRFGRPVDPMKYVSAENPA